MKMNHREFIRGILLALPVFAVAKLPKWMAKEDFGLGSYVHLTYQDPAKDEQDFIRICRDISEQMKPSLEALRMLADYDEYKVLNGIIDVSNMQIDLSVPEAQWWSDEEP